MFDTFHVTYEQKTLSSYVADMGADLIHLHAAETDRNAIGDGEMDWIDLLSALTSVNYQGYFTVETGFGRRGIDPLDIAARSLTFIREKLNMMN